MLKRMFICIAFFLDIVALSSEESYFFVRKWYYRADDLAGEVKTLLTLSKINENSFEMLLVKEMTPLPELLVLCTKATYNMEKYEFHCMDGWGNAVFGYFNIKNDEEIILYLDCNDFSEEGKNLGRLYGDTIILTKGTIIF